jgi:hypothetical protein
MSKKLATATIALVLSVLGVLAASPSVGAKATSSGVYIVTPQWWGWCPHNGVHAVYGWNLTNGASAGDAGDDIIWLGVNLNQPNEISVQVECNGGLWSTATYTWIRPTRNGQSWFIGTNAGTWHN